MKQIPFRSSHNLPFEVAAWTTPDFLRFRIGTCSGLWRCTAASYDILAIKNDRPGNGHLADVFEWFEQSCIRDHRNLQILEVMNPKFKRHLIRKRGFQPVAGTDNLEKVCVDKSNNLSQSDNSQY